MTYKTSNTINATSIATVLMDSLYNDYFTAAISGMFSIQKVETITLDGGTNEERAKELMRALKTSRIPYDKFEQYVQRKFEAMGLLIEHKTPEKKEDIKQAIGIVCKLIVANKY